MTVDHNNVVDRGRGGDVITVREEKGHGAVAKDGRRLERDGGLAEGQQERGGGGGGGRRGAKHSKGNVRSGGKCVAAGDRVARPGKKHGWRRRDGEDQGRGERAGWGWGLAEGG